MLNGDFHGRSGLPIVEGIVQFPRLGIVKAVKFLVDTGCDSTTLMPDDGLKMGIPWDDLTAGGTATGIGGRVQQFVERGVVAFAERDGRIHTYRFDISIMPPLPSLRSPPPSSGATS